ncbi:MAG: homoserine O-succinyltransferase [Verrucomicrobia bacterium]|nr:homoserine O-succinyltransferase [Verrucomicrobiota bacterium]MDA1067927.1 homoserine O-succinyltransferase [Verrucomicrobiota bacterium]
MPIKIPDDLPAKQRLKAENIFVMSEHRAMSQDIRPLEVVVLNLMPNKIDTETQLMRLLGNTPIQINITLLTTASYTSKNTSKEHLINFYKTWDEIKHLKFDGLIVTGAPIELLPWEEVAYWDELKQILDWSRTHVWSCFFICWGAQAALHHFYGIEKHELPSKKFGVFTHKKLKSDSILLRGFDDEFLVPVSRHTEVFKEDIEKEEKLEILSESKDSGLYIVRDKSTRRLFVFNHSEYEADSLKNEYDRDVNKNLPIEVPENYFPDNDPSKQPVLSWRAHSYLLYNNWLNYYVYQSTPFDFNKIG